MSKGRSGHHSNGKQLKISKHQKIKGKMINIAGIDKAKLLMALHQNSQAQGMSYLHEREVSLTDCQKRLQLTSDVDYFAGRVIKCDLSTDQLDEHLYDRDNGNGAAERVVDSLR